MLGGCVLWRPASESWLLVVCFAVFAIVDMIVRAWALLLLPLISRKC